jgi:hypothetical protein
MSAFGDPADWSDPSAAQIRLVLQLMQRIHTAIPVKVISCTNEGGISPIGRVTVQPMVQLLSDQGIVSARARLVDLPYMRVQAGSNGIIMDPEAGDLGAAIFAEKDISSVLATLDLAPPGSARVFDMADGIYGFTIMSAAPPSQYVQFSAAGIAIVSPTKISFTAPEVEINASTGVTITTPTVTVSGDVVAGGVSLIHHLTSAVQSGGGTSGPPV